jgi:hypothetical protein
MVPELAQALGSVSELDPFLGLVMDMLALELALAPVQVLELSLPLNLVMAAALDLMMVLPLGCVPESVLQQALALDLVQDNVLEM